MDGRHGSRGDSLVRTAYDVRTDDTLTDIVAEYGDARDKEVMIILLSWLRNGTRLDDNAAHKLRALVGEKPYRYVLSVEYGDVPATHTFAASLTYGNLYALMGNIRRHAEDGGLEETFRLYAEKKRLAHAALARMLGDGTKLPSRSYGTFYRYNLMLYLLTRKFTLWRDDYAYKTLLPCNDKVFDKAAELGITHKRLNTSLNSAMTLTNIARERFGEDFYRMYELLVFG